MLARWLQDAEAAGNFDVTAMALATANLTGQPSVRWVLLKHFDARGLCFYTDGRSRKGQELAVHGWIYGIKDGLLHDLDLCISGPDQIPDVYRAWPDMRPPHRRR